MRLSNKNLFKNSQQIINYLDIKKKDITITTLPMAYSFGLSILNTHLESGSTIVINNDPVFSKNFWLKIKNYNICSFGTVPAVYEYLKKIKFENFISKSLKYLTVAGGKTKIETLKYLLKTCKKKKIKFFVMYGQTEASPRMSYFDLTKYPEKIGSIGKTLKNSKFEISKDELVFYGENVSLGYAKNLNDLKKGDINKGKIKTGDLGYKDMDNFYYLTGRKKRISKLFGLRINLDDIETYLSEKGYKVYLKINDEKIDISYYHKYSEEKIKRYVQLKYNINKNFISCIHKKQKPKNIFK